MSNFTEIKPRELKPALLELDGISRASIEAHYRLYQGYVDQAERDPRQARGGRPVGREPGLLRAAGTEGRPELRDRRDQEPRDLLRPSRRLEAAIRPAPLDALDRARLRLGRGVARRSAGDRPRRARLGLDGLRLGRAAAVQPHRRRAEHLSGVECDAARRARRLRARVLPRLPDRPGAYIDAFFANLDWDVVNGWIATYGIPTAAVASAVLENALIVAGGYLIGSIPFGRASSSAPARRGHPRARAAATSARRTCGACTVAGSASPVALLDVAKGFVPALVGLKVGGEWVGVLAGSAAMLGHARPIWLGFSEGRQDGGDGRRRGLALAPLAAVICLRRLARDVRDLFRYASARLDRDGSRPAGSLPASSASPGRRSSSRAAAAWR